MIQVGLTGGIGAGKTTVAKIFSVLRVPVYNSDIAAKRLMTEDAELKEGITNLFGSKAYKDGMLNRKLLAEQIFSDSELRALLNSLVHPAVGRDYEKWLISNSSHPYVLKETAILFEVGIYQDMQLNISVSAEEKLRIDRVMQRDKVTQEDVLKRMASQWHQSKKDSMADYIIYNDYSVSLIKQVVNCHHFILKRS